MGILIFFTAPVICLLGAYFIAVFAFRKIWKSTGVAHKQLAGFTLMLVGSFIALYWAMAFLVLRHISFGR